MRKSLLAGDAALDPDWVRTNKQGIDELIAQIFNNVSSAQQADARAQQNKRKRDDSEDNAAASGSNALPQRPSMSRPESGSTAATVTKTQNSRAITPQTKQEIDDAEYAKRVSEELNSRSRSTRGGSANAAPTTQPNKKRKAGKSKIKSPSKIIDSDASASDGSEDDDDSKSSRKKPAKKRGASTRTGEEGGAKGGFQKEFALSEPLSAVCEDARLLSRPQVVKALWKYIKVSLPSDTRTMSLIMLYQENQLQNPRNKREILCDDKVGIFPCAVSLL